MFCQFCGRENSDSACYCVGCGHQLVKNIQGRNIDPNFEGRRGGNKIKVYAEGKKPMLALILSLLIVGLGQFYNGDAKKGALMLGGAVLGGILSASLLWWAMAIWSAYDAYKVASKTKPIWK